ncbi:hypothetical protein LDENG_00039870 [Lucifuga dentata]|nr:hypothetical protein LDENG_00039870 [Lucifuga dentata]
MPFLILSPQVAMIDAISVLNPDKCNFVKFFESFEDLGNGCLVYEMLDKDLYTLIENPELKPLSLNEIRPIAQQLFVALDALKSIGVIHGDLKPDNLMLVNHKDQPYRIKLIDFGLSIKVSEAYLGRYIQPLGFMAPEVALGLPFNEAIDMFSAGCILTLLYMAKYLFPIGLYEMTTEQYAAITSEVNKETQHCEKLGSLDNLITVANIPCFMSGD